MHRATFRQSATMTEQSIIVFRLIVMILRISVSACFIGHGMWGLVSKPGWLPFFKIINVPEVIALQIMPYIGSIDIIVGVLILFVSNKWLVYWAIFWTAFTELLRPLAAMGFSEFIERAGNFGPPIALLICLNMIAKNEITNEEKLKYGYIKIEKILRLSLFLLLIGHAGIAMIHFQPNLIKNLSFLGYPTEATGMYFFGAFEIVLAILVLWKPRLTGLMIFVMIFKLMIESIYPLRGIAFDIFETIERVGDYLIPLCLLLIYKFTHYFNPDLAR